MNASLRLILGPAYTESNRMNLIRATIAQILGVLKLMKIKLNGILL
jgi:hypothetical protein